MVERSREDNALDSAMMRRDNPAADPAAELRQRTRELHESEERFRNIVERTSDGIMIIGADGEVHFANPAASLLFGRPVADLEGQPFGMPLLEGETTELDIVRPHGADAIVVELRTSTTQWQGASAQLVSMRDITDRKRSEQRAQRLLLERAAREQAEAERSRSRFLAEASATLDASLDLDTTLAELARLLVPRLADWCLIDVLGANDARIIVGAHERAELQPVLDELRRSLLAAVPLSERFCPDEPTLLADLDGPRLLQWTGDRSGAALLEKLGTRSVVMLPLRSRVQQLGAMVIGCGDENFDQADFTLAEEVAARAARAIENARLYRAALAASQAKSDFLAIVSHELRTPLNAIMGYTDMLYSGIYGALSEEQRAKLARIDTSARHLLGLIEEILAHASLERDGEKPRPQHFQLHDLIDGVTAVTEPLARARNLELAVDVNEPTAACFTDVMRIRQIVVNLLSNAVKFTLSGRVTLKAGLASGELVIAVSDSGLGIQPEHLHLIFEPFWQAEQPLRREFGGTGLGLSVSRRLAELLGGTISVQSQPGAGSTFTLRVPARLPAHESGRDERRDFGAPPHSRSSHP